MQPMLNYKPPWFKRALTRANLKKAAGWLAVLAFFAFILWPDSHEKKTISEVNERTTNLLQKFDTLTDEEIVKELEAIKTLTDPPPPEPDDGPY